MNPAKVAYTMIQGWVSIYEKASYNAHLQHAHNRAGPPSLCYYFTYLQHVLPFSQFDPASKDEKAPPCGPPQARALELSRQHTPMAPQNMVAAQLPSALPHSDRQSIPVEGGRS